MSPAPTIDDVWRDYNTRGVPASGDHKPVKSEIRRLMKSILGGTAAVGDFQGAWAIGTAYVATDYVEHGGSLWLAKRDNVGVTPVEGADWTLLLPGVTVADGTINNAKVSPTAAIAATKLSYLLSATDAQTRTAQSRLSDMVSVFDFMTAAETASVLARNGAVDVTAAINKAIASGRSVFMLDGLARCDGTVVIGASQSLTLGPNAKLKRFALKVDGVTAGSQLAVLHVKGNWARYSGGSIESLCNSPGGVVACGHLTHNDSAYNSLFWRFENCDVYCKDFGGVAASPYPNLAQGIGVYVPSSQPYLGSSACNYFGLIANITIYNPTTGIYLNDLANSHQLTNIRVDHFYQHAFLLAGAYGNTILGCFLNGTYRDNAEAIYLTTKNYPAAPHASSLQSNYNHITGLTSELYTTGSITLKIDALCQNNFVQIGHNSGGSVYWTDLDGANTVLEAHKSRIGGTLTTDDLRPSTNGGCSLGTSTLRWSNIYLVNEPVVTSDGRAKQDISSLSPAEVAVAKKIPGLVRKYRLSEDVDRQSDGPKWQVGIVAQDLITAFAAEQLNVADYGLFNVGEDGALGLRYGQLSMLALAAVAG